jgi:chemotaxis protein histidine kinase CheA
MYGKKLSYASENCLTHQKIFESAREAKMNQKLNRAPLARANSPDEERLDPRRAADKIEDDVASEQPEQRLQDVSANVAEAEEARDRPSSRESGADDLRSDQNRGADDRNDVCPVHPAASTRTLGHLFAPKSARAFRFEALSGLE